MKKQTQKATQKASKQNFGCIQVHKAKKITQKQGNMRGGTGGYAGGLYNSIGTAPNSGRFN